MSRLVVQPKTQNSPSVKKYTHFQKSLMTFLLNIHKNHLSSKAQTGKTFKTMFLTGFKKKGFSTGNQKMLRCKLFAVPNAK